MAHRGFKHFIPGISAIILVCILLAAGIVYQFCGQVGLVSKKYTPDFYRVPKLLPDGPMEENPRFIFYGDSRPGWRIHEKFLKRDNWLTWKIVFFPFYDFYWLGNDIAAYLNVISTHLNVIPAKAGIQSFEKMYYVYYDGKQKKWSNIQITGFQPSLE